MNSVLHRLVFFSYNFITVLSAASFVNLLVSVDVCQCQVAPRIVTYILTHNMDVIFILRKEKKVDAI